jgi:hypothetical protein
MKKIICILLCAGISNFVSAQTKVPAVVEAGFHQKFPKAASVKWEKESKSEYEASFTHEGKKCSASFSPDGKWMETEIEISAAPASITEAFHKTFPGATIGQVYQIDADHKPVYYELEYVLNGKKEEAKFDAGGKLMH